MRRGNRSRCAAGMTAAALFSLLVLSAATPVRAEAEIVVRAKTLYTGAGAPIDGGVVVIRGGEIVAVGASVPVPEGATVIDVEGGSITAGLIDANAVVERTDRMVLDTRPATAEEVLHELFHGDDHEHPPGIGCCGSSCPKSYNHATGDKCPACGFPDSPIIAAEGVSRSGFQTEQSDEVIPHTRVLDSVNLYSADFDRLASGGVTTVFVTAHSSAVIGSRGTILRTAGPVKDRVVEAESAVKATIGADPSWRDTRNRQPFRRRVSFLNRRPTTRMGVAWVFRKAFHDAQRASRGLAPYGADTPPEASLEVLQQILAGDIGLRIQARNYVDIVTALRVTEEFGLPFVLEEGIEAYKAIDELQARNIPVIFGPIFVDAPGFRGRSMDRFGFEARLHTFDKLLNSGLTTALTAHELRDEDGLARQGMYAARMGSDPEQVLAAVTTTPAKLLGIEKSVGTVETGKRADLVVWSGKPFGATSEPVVVMVGGEVVADARGK